MSVMRLQPVFKCRQADCGRVVTVTHLSTTRPDEGGERLLKLMQGLQKIALCDFHQAQRNWYASQGRAEEWEQMASGQGLLLVVRDPRKDRVDVQEG